MQPEIKESMYRLPVIQKEGWILCITKLSVSVIFDGFASSIVLKKVSLEILATTGKPNNGWLWQTAGVAVEGRR